MMEKILCTSRQSQHANIRNNTVVCRQKFLLLQFRSRNQSINTVCLALWKQILFGKRRSKWLFRRSFFFSPFLTKVNIYIYIKHRYKKVSSTSCVWQHLLHIETLFSSGVKTSSFLLWVKMSEMMRAPYSMLAFLLEGPSFLLLTKEPPLR